jgi:hypothetical protein
LSNYHEGNGGEAGQGTGVMPPPSPGYQQPPMYQQPGYGYGMRPFGWRSQRPFPTETKPFFLTSEFVVSLVAELLIAITAASSHAFGAWRAWILITAIVVAYSFSRGLAKAGTRSHARDPREHLDLTRGHDHQNAQTHQQ